MARVKQTSFIFLFGLLILLQQLREGSHAARVPDRRSQGCPGESTTGSSNFSVKPVVEASSAPPPSSSPASPPSGAHVDREDSAGGVAKSPQANVDPQEQPGSEKSEATVLDEGGKTAGETKRAEVIGRAGFSTAGGGEGVREAQAEPPLSESTAAESLAHEPHVCQRVQDPRTGEEEPSGPATVERRAPPARMRISWPNFLRSSKLFLEPEESSEGSNPSLQTEKQAVYKLLEQALTRAYDYKHRIGAPSSPQESYTAATLEMILAKCFVIYQRMGKETAATTAEEEEKETTGFLEHAIEVIKLLLTAPFIASPGSCVKTLPFIELHMRFRPRRSEHVKIALDQLAISFLDIRAQAERAIRALDRAQEVGQGKGSPSSLATRSVKEKLGGGGAAAKWRAMLRKVGTRRSFYSTSSDAAEDGPGGAAASSPGRPLNDKEAGDNDCAFDPSSSQENRGDDRPTAAASENPAAGKPLGARSKRFSFRRKAPHEGQGSAGVAGCPPGAATVDKLCSETPSTPQTGCRPCRATSRRFSLRRSGSRGEDGDSGASESASGAGCSEKPATKSAESPYRGKK